ncbi:MAG: efflux RND transporter permease subunit [Acidobacteria bacterium]|nr:efflux RND transporter permease subunit [Acidobacteriota bacterium]
MNIAETFIRRPVATTLLMLSLLIFGAMGYRLLPVNDLPNVDFPTISVSASLPGASPETMAAAVATPLEKQFSTIAGVDSMTSSSALGGTNITLQFSLDRDIDAAAQDVQTAIAQTLGQLPRDMPNPPTYRKVNPADQPIVFMALSSANLPLSTVDEYAQTFIAQRISMINGVAQVQVYGSQKYAVRVWVDPDAMSIKGIGIDEVVTAVQRANQNLPAGTLDGDRKSFTLMPDGQLYKAESYRPVIVAYRNGAPVRLQEIGTAVDSVENDKVAAWFRDKRAIVLAVQRQPGTNTVEVAENIRKLLPVMRKQIPPAINLEILFDRSETIRESVDDVKFTLVLTMVLVVLVIFVFLRSFTATVIPSLALPMSVVGTFAVIYAMGFSVNNLTLMALTLAVGFVVDDAIVMLENIVRHVEMGKPPMKAALDGAKEIGFTIVSMTISLAAVFIPLVFMGGIVGRLFREFALTICVAILVSGVVSLTLTPMLCSRFLHAHRERRNVLYRWSEKGFDLLLKLYEVTLRFAVRHRFATMVVSAAMLAGMVHFFGVIPKGFLPNEDNNQVMISTEAVEGISFDDMKRHQLELAAVLLKDPNVDAFMCSVGSGGPNASGNTGRFFIRLKPRKERRLTAEQFVEAVRPALNRTPGIRAFLTIPPPITIGGRWARSQYQFTLQSPDTDDLYQVSAALEKRMKELPEIQDVTSDLQLRNPQVDIDLDRDLASSLGITVQQIEETLYSAYGSRQVSTIYAPNNQYRVIVELLPEDQLDPAALAKLYVRSSSGKLVPLNAVARLNQVQGPLSVNHQGQLPAVTLSFNLKPGISLGTAVDSVTEAARKITPDTVSSSFQGTAQAFEASMQGMGMLLILSIFVIYVILGILYESFIHPVTILSGLPSAGLGALLILLLFRVELNLYGLVGMVMLIGIVKKNAIMMIDFALEAQRKQGKPPAEAIVDGCLIRFRPIMMTTMAALMGTLPIALGMGAGAESRRPLGLVVVGGLLISQVVTLYLTPVFYIYMELIKARLQRRRASDASPPDVAPDLAPGGAE